MKLKVAIIEKNISFLDRLTAVFSKNYSDKLEVYPFTDPDVALSTLGYMNVNILLADEGFPISTESLPQNCAFAYFVSSVGTDQLHGQPTICKFQRAELIYKQIVGIFTEKLSAKSSGSLSGSESKCIVFTSPAGGVGVSASAAAYALRLASQGKKVLYLDANLFASPSLYFHGDGHYYFGDVLHTLVHKDGNLADLISRAVRKDARGVYFFKESPSDTIHPSITAEDISKLLREIRITASYDFIVLDIPFFMWHEKVDLLSKAQTLIMVADNTQLCEEKILRGYKFLLHNQNHDLEISKPDICLLFNKCNSFPIKNPSLFDLRELGTIPLMQPTESEAALVAHLASLPLFDALI